RSSWTPKPPCSSWEPRWTGSMTSFSPASRSATPMRRAAAVAASPSTPDPVKLFQIEEPEGPPGSADGPGVGVGIEIAEEAAIAFALGGNAEVLARVSTGDITETLLQLRGRAEKMLARP